MDNRYDFTGVVCDLGEEEIFSQYFKKRDIKVRYTDIDYKNNIIERVAKFTFINSDVDLVAGLHIDDVIKIEFKIDGKDVTKDHKTYNFTTLVGYDLVIISSPSRDSDEDKNATITNEGRDYEKKAKEATDEELAGAFAQDPLLAEWDKKIKEEKPDDLPF